MSTSSCIHAYIHTYITYIHYLHAYLHTYTYTYIHTNFEYIPTYIHTSILTHIYAYIHTHIHVISLHTYNTLHVHYITSHYITSHSITITKTTLKKYPSLRAEAIANDRADWLAKRARMHHLHPYIVQLSTLLQERHRKYVRFMVGVHHVVIRVHIAATRYRKSLAYKFTNTTMPTYVFHLNLWLGMGTITTFRMKFKASEMLVHEYLQGKPKIRYGLYNALRNHTCAYDNTKSGVTWLELFLIA